MGAGSMVRTKDELVAAQGALLVAVSVIVTLPAVISAELGVYVAFNAVADGEKLPDPEVLHWPVFVDPLTDPLRLTVCPSQIVRSGPAETTGVGRMRTTLLSAIGLQPSVAVSVSVMLPSAISAALAA